MPTGYLWHANAPMHAGTIAGKHTTTSIDMPKETTTMTTPPNGDAILAIQHPCKENGRFIGWRGGLAQTCPRCQSEPQATRRALTTPSQPSS